MPARHLGTASHFHTITLSHSVLLRHIVTKQEKPRQCEQTQIKPVWGIQQCLRSPLLPRLSVKRLHAIKVWRKGKCMLRAQPRGSSGGSPLPGSKWEDTGNNILPAPCFLYFHLGTKHQIFHSGNTWPESQRCGLTFHSPFLREHFQKEHCKIFDASFL